MDNLFSGYSQQQNTPANGRRSNMGIGLSVCAAIIRAHGGEIRAENLESGGAAFRFTLETEDEREYESL